MNEQDCRLLVEKMGKCWHKRATVSYIRKGSVTECSKCHSEDCDNQTFTSWKEFGEVWEWAKNQYWWASKFWYFAETQPDICIDTDIVDPIQFPELIIKFGKEHLKWEEATP